MQSLLLEKMCQWAACIIQHRVHTVSMMKKWAGLFNNTLRQLMGKPYLLDNIPAGRTWLDGNKIKMGVREKALHLRCQLLEKNKDLFRVPAVAEVIVAGIKNNALRR